MIEVRDDSREVFLSFFMQVGYSDTRSENGVVGMLCSEVCCCLCRKILEIVEVNIDI